MTTRTVPPKGWVRWYPRCSPPKRWRNKWRALVAFDCEGVTHYPGEEYDGEYLHPSKDVAETVAAESLAHAIALLGHAPYEYLGAFPERWGP